MLTTNSILRRLRFTFSLSDGTMQEIFALGEMQVEQEEIKHWLKKDDDPEQAALNHYQLASFLNGFITYKRGPKDGPQPEAEKQLNNNLILRKLKIALNYKDEDILNALEAADFKFSKSELSAFFRKPGHKHYRECKDQFLRNFLVGLSKLPKN
ncbi:MAG: DUF1456 family protein [Luteibaculum sp.]